MNAHPNPEKILQTGLAFFASKTLLSAVEIGVFKELAKGPQSFDSLAGRLNLGGLKSEVQHNPRGNVLRWERTTNT